MKMKNMLNLIGALAFYAIAPLTQAQCPQGCDAVFRNTAVGDGALGSGSGVSMTDEALTTL